MEAAFYILQRFFWSLGSGVIINFFIIANFFVLVKKDLLPEGLKFLSEINVSDTVAIWIFIATTVLSGILVEGFNETGFQFFTNNHSHMKKKDKSTDMKKDKSTEEKVQKDSAYRYLNIIGKILYLIFREGTTVEAGLRYTREAQNAEPKKSITRKEEKPIPNDSIYSFLSNPKYNTSTNAMQATAKRIAHIEKNGDVYMFRDLSFLVQLMRSSFFIILIISLVAVIFVFIFCGIEFYFWWWAVSSGLSLVSFLFTTPIAINFSKRYIRSIGTAYKAHEKELKDTEADLG